LWNKRASPCEFTSRHAAARQRSVTVARSDFHKSDFYRGAPSPSPSPSPPKITERPLFPAPTDSGRRKPREALRYRYSNVTPPPPPPPPPPHIRGNFPVRPLSYFFALHRVGIDKNVLFLARAREKCDGVGLERLAAPREAHGVGKYFSITPRKHGIPTLSNPALVNPRADSSASRWNRRSSLAGLMARKKFYRRRPVGATPALRNAGRWRAYLAVNLAPRSSGLIKQAFLAGSRVSRRIAGLAGTA